MKKTPNIDHISEADIAEARRNVEMKIVDVFRSLMKLDNCCRAWSGTMSDLMELAHMAWTQGQFVGRDGRLVSFRYVADHVCRVLHRRRVSNPYSLATRSMNRKSVRRMPVLERYARLSCTYKLPNPMFMDMKFV